MNCGVRMASWHQGRYPKERRRVCHARIQALLNAEKNRWVQFTTRLVSSTELQSTSVMASWPLLCFNPMATWPHGHSPGIDRGHLLVPFRKEFGCSVPGFVDRLCLKIWELIHGIRPGAQNPFRCIHILKPEQTTSFFEGKNFYRVSNKHHVC